MKPGAPNFSIQNVDDEERRHSSLVAAGALHLDAPHVAKDNSSSMTDGLLSQNGLIQYKHLQEESEPMKLTNMFVDGPCLILGPGLLLSLGLAILSVMLGFFEIND